MADDTLSVMFFRVKKTNTGYVLQLQESYRNPEGKPRSRIVVSLGTPTIPPESWQRIAAAVENRLFKQGAIFPDGLDAQQMQWVDQIVLKIERDGRWKPSVPDHPVSVIDGVDIDQIQHTQDTILGPILVGLDMWKKLQMPEILAALGMSSSQSACAAIAVINRLVEPVSEHALPQWLMTTSLGDLMEVDQPGKDRFYRASDFLLSNRERIEGHLREKTQGLFNVNRTILLYDLTNSHFEGMCAGNPKAARGKNKQKRDDCPQIVVGIVFDSDGFPLFHKVFEGNRHDSRTLRDMINQLQTVCGHSDREGSDYCVVLDGGFSSKESLAWLRSEGIPYIINESRPGRARYHEYFQQTEAFVALPDRAMDQQVEVRWIEDPASSDRLILCRSHLRRVKEQAMKSQAEARFLTALDKLAHRLRSGRLKVMSKIQRAIGRLQSQHSRVSRFYEITVNAEGSPTLQWDRKDQVYADDDDVLGGYIIRTSRQDLTPAEVWQIYITLTRAESGFKSLKGDLGLRPNFHQLEPRVDGHVFITILSYYLLRSMMYQLEQLSDYRSWPTIRRILQTHCYATLIVPSRNGVWYIRKSGLPDEQQKQIYEALGVNWQSLPVTKQKI